MATLVIPRTVQVSIEMVCSGQPVWNVIHLDMGTEGFYTPASVLPFVKSAWEIGNGPLARHTTTTSMVGYHYVDLDSATGAVGFLASTASGNNASGLSALSTCALIKLGSGSRSRSTQGRMYHGPLAEAQVNADGRSLASTTITDLTNTYEAFRVAMATANTPWCVASRKNLNKTVITSVGAAGIIGTQRRRIR